MKIPIRLKPIIKDARSNTGNTREHTSIPSLTVDELPLLNDYTATDHEIVGIGNQLYRMDSSQNHGYRLGAYDSEPHTMLHETIEAGEGITIDKNADTITISSSSTSSLEDFSSRVVGIYNTLEELESAYPSPTESMYAIVLNGNDPDMYYEAKGKPTVWTEKAPVVSSYPNYGGAFGGTKESLPDVDRFPEGTFIILYEETDIEFLTALFLKSNNKWKGINTSIVGAAYFIQHGESANLRTINTASGGKYGDERLFYPTSIYQNPEGGTHVDFTGVLEFRQKNNATNNVNANSVAKISDGNIRVYRTTEVHSPLTVLGDSGRLLELKNANGGSSKVTFWSSGAIELPNYTNFKDKELVTKEYVDNAVGSGSSYTGQGLGVPYRQLISTTPLTQSVPVMHYANNTQRDDTWEVTLDQESGYNEFRTIISGGYNSSTRDYRVKTNANKYTTKRIRTGELWECRSYVVWDDNNKTNFFWTRLDEGTSTFAEVAQTELFKMAAATISEFPSENFVIKTDD